MGELYNRLNELINKKCTECIKDIVKTILEDNGVILYQSPLFIEVIPNQNLPFQGEYIGKAIIIDVYYPTWKISIIVSEKNDVIGQPLVECRR